MKIVISGEPIPWMRPGKGRKGTKTWMYDEQMSVKQGIRWVMKSELNKCFDNPASRIAKEASSVAAATVLSVSLTFLFKPNKSDSERLKRAKVWGIIPHNEKPDCDNLMKFYLDCGNGLLWSDDKILNRGKIRKDYSNNPRTIIEIMTKENLKTGSKTRKILEIFGPEELNQLAEDIKDFDYLSKENILDHSGEGEAMDKQQWQFRTAVLLAQFAKKYGDALHKINKYKAMNFDEMPLGLYHIPISGTAPLPNSYWKY